MRKILEDAGDLSPAAHLSGLLAVRYADAVDRAARDGDEVALMKSADKLLGVLAAFQVAGPVTPAGGETGGADGDRSRVVSLLDRPPAVGD